MSVDTQIDTQVSKGVDTQSEKPKERIERTWSLGRLLKRAVGWREGSKVSTYNELTHDSEGLHVDLDEKDAMWLQKLAESGVKPSPEELAAHLDQYAYEIAADPSDEVVSGVGTLLEMAGERGVPARMDQPQDPAVGDKIKRTVNDLLGRKDAVKDVFIGKGKEQRQRRCIEVDRVPNTERAYKILHERLRPVVERFREVFYTRGAKAEEIADSPPEHVVKLAHDISTFLQAEAEIPENGRISEEQQTILAAFFEQLYLLELTSQVPILERTDAKYQGIKDGRERNQTFMRDRRVYEAIRDHLYPELAKEYGLPGIIEDGKYLRVQFPDGTRQRFLPVEQLAGIYEASRELTGVIDEREAEFKERQDSERVLRIGSVYGGEAIQALLRVPNSVQETFRMQVVRDVLDQLQDTTQDVFVSLKPVIESARNIPGTMEERAVAVKAADALLRTTESGLKQIRYGSSGKNMRGIQYQFSGDSWTFRDKSESARKLVKAFFEAFLLERKVPEMPKKPKFWQRWFQKRNVA